MVRCDAMSGNDGGQRGARRRVVLARWWARARQILTTDPSTSDEDDAVLDDAAADALTREARASHGALAKVAQLAAYDPGALFGDELDPERGFRTRASATLGQLWDRAAAVDRSQISAIIEEELGKPPGELFASWNPEPIAAASLGQVHEATGHDGQDYVVKVQYPGVRAALDADLRDGSFARRLAGAQLSGAVDEESLAVLVESMRGELDYHQEAGALAAFAAVWAEAPGLSFPEVDAERSSGRVLTMTRARGFTLPQLVEQRGARAQALRQAAAAAIYRFTWGSPLAFAVLNTDPNPGNFLVEDTPRGVRVWCLDFGATAVVPQSVVEADRELWWALLDRDAEGAAERFRMGLAGMGLLRRTDSLHSDVHRAWELALLRPFQQDGPFLFDSAYARELATATGRALAAGGLRLSPRTLMLWRQRLAAAAVIGLLGSTVNCRAILEDLIGNGRRALR